MTHFETLTVDKIKAVLDPNHAKKLEKIEVFTTIDSTNTYLLAQAKKNVSGWVCFAEEQTEGRGRLGRPWFSPLGPNLYCSLLWDFGSQDVSALGIVIGVAVIRALEKYGVNNLHLKWPNDVLFGGKKLAGILLERTGTTIVIGIGMNVCLPETTDLKLNAIDLTAILNNPIQRNVLAGLLVNELLHAISLYHKNGFAAFLTKWRQHDCLLGKKITVHAGENSFNGDMQGVNEKGELLLRDATGTVQSFCYGEVTISGGLWQKAPNPPYV